MGAHDTYENRRATRSVVVFFVVVFAMGAVFYSLGPLVGSLSKVTRADVPASALMFICPSAAALLLVYRAGGQEAVSRFLRVTLRWPDRAYAGWYIPAAALLPVMLLTSYAALRWFGPSLPPPHLAWSALPVLVAVYLVAALGEEVGWSGYAVGPLQQRWGELPASLVIGTVWGLWHVIPYCEAGRGAGWIVWQCVFTVGMRVVLTWLYNNTGRNVVAPIICHASYNVAWSLFPNSGSQYSPFLAAIGILVVVVGIISAVWRPATQSKAPAPA